MSFWSYLLQLVAIGLAATLILLGFVAGGLALDRWNRGLNAEQEKQRCISEGYRAVPSVGGYWCR